MKKHNTVNFTAQVYVLKVFFPIKWKYFESTLWFEQIIEKQIIVTHTNEYFTHKDKTTKQIYFISTEMINTSAYSSSSRVEFIKLY